MKKRKNTSPSNEFGPFLLPQEYVQQIKPVGFKCLDCRKAVRRLFKVVPGSVVRMVFYNCDCGTICVWEDERQPQGQHQWRNNTALMRKSGAKVLIFNGNKPLAPDFSGLS